MPKNVKKGRESTIKRDVTESIKYHSQSEACVGGLSLEAHCTHNEMDKYII